MVGVVHTVDGSGAVVARPKMAAVPPPSPAPAAAAPGAARDPRVASELYFLVAKLLSTGPLREIGQVLRRELEKRKILPKRLDWLGNEREQTFEELETQHQAVTDDHLLSVCTALLKTTLDKPKKSLLCTSLFQNVSPHRPNNILDILTLRARGVRCDGHRSLAIPASVYGSLQLQRTTLGHLSSAYCVLFDRSGRYIITGADDMLVKIWSAVDGRLLETLRGASAEITDIAVDTNNQLLAAGSLDRLVRVWLMKTAAPIAVLQGHSGMITSVHFCPAFSGDLSCLVSTSTDGSVAFWTYSQTDIGRPSFISKPVQYVERMRPGASQMICAAWSPGGAFLAAGSADHHVRVYMMAESGPKRIVETAAHTDAVDSLQWAHVGLRFVSGSKDGSAIMWQLHAMQWRHTKLNMSDTLPDDVGSTEENKKLKVTMVAWNCTDTYIITAVSDFSLKVWCSLTGKLIRVLRGHSDEVYVLECHPSHSDVLLSAGHDGQIFLWNLTKGIIMTAFVNNVDGQGHSAVYDAKWSSDGTKVAATDSQGHLLVFGFGKGHFLYEELPRELFFHTDYRPLVWDSHNNAFDEQTGIPPHLMIPPFLVDVEGNPHHGLIQCLVPGREYRDNDQIVPNIGPEAEGIISNAADNFAIQHVILMNDMLNDNDQQLNNDVARRNSTEESRNRLARDNARMNGENIYDSTDGYGGTWRMWKSLVPPLSKSFSVARKLYIEEMVQMEMSWYGREMRRRPLMISTCTTITDEKKIPSRKGRTRGAPKPRRSQPVTEREYEEPPDIVSPNHSDSDSSVRLSISGDTVSDSSDSCDNSSSSSEYSDWVADQPGVPLEPPKRSKRKPAKQTKAQQTPEKKTESNSIPKLTEIPEAYRPSEWLCAVLPRKAPYHPQMGDECIYFKQGHYRYLEAVIDKNVYKVSSRDKPWEKIELKDSEVVKVIGIKYVIRPPRLVCLKLALENGTTFTVRYHDMPDVIDFFVLRQMYDIAVERNWGPEDRFRSMIDDKWWMGVIVENTNLKDENASSSVNDTNCSHFLSLRVRWDNDEYEQMSPWDLEPIDESRLPDEIGGCVSVLPSELKNLLYKPRLEEWPSEDRDEACYTIARGIDQVMGLAIAEPFIAPVDLSIYPTYAYIVEYPIDLSTIKSRFENHFYRRITSAQFDVRYLATNAEKFNLPHTPIVKQARIITELCLEIMRSPYLVDVQAHYRLLMDSYNSSDSDVPLAKQTSDKISGSYSNWYSSCRTVLKGIIAASDSAPFMEPVLEGELLDYHQIVLNPMDLSTAKSRLESGLYQTPKDFAKDIRLIFSNSRLYNTDRKSLIYEKTIRLSTMFEALFKPVMENWKAAKKKKIRKLSEDSLSDFDDCMFGLQNGNGINALMNGNNTHKKNNGYISKKRVKIVSSDSWDSHSPSKEVKVYKGKGRGKRTMRKNNEDSFSISPENHNNYNTTSPVFQNSHSVNGEDSYEETTSSDEEQDSEDYKSELENDDSEDSYKPTKKSNGGVNLFYCSRNTKKRFQGNKKKSDRRNKRNNKSVSRKRKRINGHNGDSSSDTGVSVASVRSKRRYESDDSFQLRTGSNSDSDDNKPLESIRRVNNSSSNNSNNNSNNSGVGVQNDFRSASLRLRQRRMLHSDESMPGTSTSTNRVRRTVRDSKRPKYNEDSEEDSIAAISKRHRARQHPHSSRPRTITSLRNQRSEIEVVTFEERRNDVLTSPETAPSNDGVSFHSPNDTFTAEDDEPLSVSSRGRIRKLTPKAKNLLRD